MYNFIITIGLIGFAIILIMKYLLERWGASTSYKRELRKQVFQRKTDCRGVSHVLVSGGLRYV